MPPKRLPKQNEPSPNRLPPLPPASQQAPVNARDALRLDWLNDNGTKFAMPMRSDYAFELEWLDDEGWPNLTQGGDIRTCIDAAIARQAAAPAEGVGK